MSTYNVGDLVIITKSGNEHYGEVVGVDIDGKLEVSCLQKTPMEHGKLWKFTATDEFDAVEPTAISKHVAVPKNASRRQVVNAWKEVGFLPGGDGISFCRLEDETSCSLPMYGGDESDSEDDGEASSNPKMHGYESDGFVVPDDEGSDFEFADPNTLSAEAAKFVEETHQAVRDFDQWQPEDKQGKGIKAFIERMDHKATIETDNKRFSHGKESISTSKPPLKKKQRKQ
jgi:hypothetical protein